MPIQPYTITDYIRDITEAVKRIHRRYPEMAPMHLKRVAYEEALWQKNRHRFCFSTSDHFLEWEQDRLIINKIITTVLQEKIRKADAVFPIGSHRKLNSELY